MVELVGGGSDPGACAAGLFQPSGPKPTRYFSPPHIVMLPCVPCLVLQGRRLDGGIGKNALGCGRIFYCSQESMNNVM